MSSRYGFFSFNAARRRICQAAGVIAVSLLWTGGPPRFHVTAEEVSLRGAAEGTEIQPPPEVSAPTDAPIPSTDSGDAAALEPPPPTELVCGTAGKYQAIITSARDSVRLSCRGGFAVHDVSGVGEVFAADCKTHKALQIGNMRAALDHDVDDTGAFRTLTVSNFPSEDEQLCLACARGEINLPESEATQVPDNQLCSVVITIVGTDKGEPAVEGQQEQQKTTEQEPKKESKQGSKQESEQEATPEPDASQQPVPQEGEQQASPAQLPQEPPPQQEPRHQRHTQRLALRQPQQQTEQPSEEQPSPQVSPKDATQQPSVPVEDDEAQRSNPEGEQLQDEAQQEGGERNTEEGQDTTTNGEQEDKPGDSDPHEEQEAKSKPSPQCTTEDLHLSVSAGESVSFTCGGQTSLMPQTSNLVYEEGEGKCGEVETSISDLVPEAQVTKEADATVVSLAAGASEGRTVCYRCVGDGAGTEIGAETHQEECVVFITFKPSLHSAPVETSGALAHSSSFLVGVAVFLGAVLHLLQ